MKKIVVIQYGNNTKLRDIRDMSCKLIIKIGNQFKANFFESIKAEHFQAH